MSDEEYFSDKSSIVFLNPQDLKYWKNEKTKKKVSEIDILNRCRKINRLNPSYNDLFDYSSESVTG